MFYIYCKQSNKGKDDDTCGVFADPLTIFLSSS